MASVQLREGGSMASMYHLKSSSCFKWGQHSYMVLRLNFYCDKKVYLTTVLFMKIARQSSTFASSLYILAISTKGHGTSPSAIILLWLYLVLYKHITLTPCASNSHILSSLLFATGTFCVFMLLNTSLLHSNKRAYLTRRSLSSFSCSWKRTHDSDFRTQHRTVEYKSFLKGLPFNVCFTDIPATALEDQKKMCLGHIVSSHLWTSKNWFQSLNTSEHSRT